MLSSLIPFTSIDVSHILYILLGSTFPVSTTGMYAFFSHFIFLVATLEDEKKRARINHCIHWMTINHKRCIECRAFVNTQF
jgi:hypothetical protein